ncbi:MAG: DNA mismatch repair endonuclease MutL [Lactobacillus sp.]|nr:DNA mismatch repair endonuclease MutL [Lactobacillus sp.]MDN6042917.1 DNA mismatch repair endonuclease MutL [Lactobacillus sp.]MDN6052704.1 DNA mismatch repair endonuclease MutL [Lactobacillus sp.]
MTKIHELSENLANQIAAGEVIERPASVVKELVENAIDAGSTQIRVEVRSSGLAMIMVQDNGVGIPADQLDLAFTRHATSKINNERDLFKVATLGFRGEALASIAAVSHVEVLTALAHHTGVVANFSTGVKSHQSAAAAREGTRITVSDLFFNTPARLKYLRSPRTELMKVVDFLDRIALGHPQIAFTLVSEGKILLQTAGNGDQQQTVATIYGHHVAAEMLPFATQDTDFTVTGLLSKPTLTRSNRHFMTLLLNGRYITNLVLTNAIMTGYGSQLPQRHYPIAVINIQVDPLLVDVNVHPTKREVRLSKETALARLLTTAISTTLTNQLAPSSGLTNLLQTGRPTLVDQLRFNLNQQVVNSKRPEITKPSTTELASSDAKEPDHKYVSMKQVRSDDRYLLTASWDANVREQQTLRPFPLDPAGNVESSAAAKLSSRLPQLTYLGQFDSYLLASADHDLYLLDAPAIQRRLIYERLLGELTNHQISQQQLLTPLVLDFGELDFLEIKAKLPLLRELGLLLAEFGQHSFILHGYPNFLQDNQEARLRELIELFLHQDEANPMKWRERLARDEARHQAAARSKLTAVAAASLLAKLAKVPDPYHDPDGRLTLVAINQRDLQKMFKR